MKEPTTMSIPETTSVIELTDQSGALAENTNSHIFLYWNALHGVERYIESLMKTLFNGRASYAVLAVNEVFTSDRSGDARSIQFLIPLVKGKILHVIGDIVNVALMRRLASEAELAYVHHHYTVEDQRYRAEIGNGEILHTFGSTRSIDIKDMGNHLASQLGFLSDHMVFPESRTMMRGCVEDFIRVWLKQFAFKIAPQSYDWIAPPKGVESFKDDWARLLYGEPKERLESNNQVGRQDD